MEKTGYPEAVRASGAPARNPRIQDQRPKHQQAGIGWKRSGSSKSGESQSLYLSDRKTVQLRSVCGIQYGARYFIRELLKPFSETERSLLEAKVPSVKRRTSCVYADLQLLSAELASQKAA